MQIQFHQGSGEISDRGLARAQIKLSKLSRFINETMFESQVRVDVERESGSQNSDSMWRTSIRLDVAGDHFNASETADTPEKALDLSIKELKRELRRANAKTTAARKKGGGILKRLLQGT
jgi:ribosome-associated translation inhibitor RaiA